MRRFNLNANLGLEMLSVFQIKRFMYEVKMTSSLKRTDCQAFMRNNYSGNYDMVKYYLRLNRKRFDKFSPGLGKFCNSLGKSGNNLNVYFHFRHYDRKIQGKFASFEIDRDNVVIKLFENYVLDAQFLARLQLLQKTIEEADAESIVLQQNARQIREEEMRVRRELMDAQMREVEQARREVEARNIVDRDAFQREFAERLARVQERTQSASSENSTESLQERFNRKWRETHNG